MAGHLLSRLAGQLPILCEVGQFKDGHSAMATAGNIMFVAIWTPFPKNVSYLTQRHRHFP